MRRLARGRGRGSYGYDVKRGEQDMERPAEAQQRSREARGASDRSVLTCNTSGGSTETTALDTDSLATSGQPRIGLWESSDTEPATASATDHKGDIDGARERIALKRRDQPRCCSACRA